MKTTFTARHFDSSESLKDYCLTSVEKLTQYYDRIVNCDIVLEPTSDEEDSQQAEIKLNVPQSFITVKEQAPTYEQAMNLAVDNAARQLKKYKDKHFGTH
ncbi:MAG: ribosome hibernation-promoting factor, HPF/YfiA family [Bacteroidota bacterium]